MFTRHLLVLAAVTVTAAMHAQAQARVAPAFAPAPMVGAPNVSLLRSSPPRPVPTPVAAAGGFASTGFAQFMSSPGGRVLRAVAGVGMVAGGLAMDSKGGNALAIAGAIPLSAGLFDICYLSPLFGGPIRGKDIRAAKK